MGRLFCEHEKRRSFSLNGAWDFCTDPEGLGEEKGYNKSLPSSKMIIVPGAWNTEIDLLKYEGVAWYQKRFYTDGGTLRFVFEAVMTEAVVYLDGEKIGYHYGGFSSFDIIVENVEGGNHTLTVRVDNSFTEESIPQSRVDWYHYGGITRGVFVETLLGIAVLYHRFDYELSLDTKTANCNSELELYNASNDDCSTTLCGRVGDEGVFSSHVSLKAGERRKLSFDYKLSNLRIWDSMKPQLYTVLVSTDTDDLFDRVGFRKLESKNRKLYLNGREIEIRGINRHEEHPDWGMAFPEGLMKRDLDIILNMGCNAIRGSHYPPSRFFLDMLDECGVMFWCEIPIWGDGFSPAALANPRVIERGLNMHREMVRQYYNHPAIVIWGMHNEIRTELPESFEMSKQYYKFLKENAKNRLVTYATNRPMIDNCFEYCDIISVNKYDGWYDDGDDYRESWLKFLSEFDKRLTEIGVSDKPVIMGEFGGAAIYGHHTFDNLKGSEEYQATLIGFCLETFHKSPLIQGAFIWQFADIRTSAQMGLDRARSFNNKGILNEYRRPKQAYGAIKKLYEAFRDEQEGEKV
jgi:beta-glucuronidase